MHVKYLALSLAFENTQKLWAIEMCTTLSFQILSSHFLFDSHKGSIRKLKQIFLSSVSDGKTNQSFAQASDGAKTETHAWLP